MNHDEGVTSAVTRIAEQFVSIWNTHDMARLADIYADDADFVNVIGMRWQGASQIAQDARAVARVAHATDHAGQ